MSDLWRLRHSERMAIKQGDPVRLTYRYLRVAIVAVVLVLFVSLTMQIVADRGKLDSGEEWWHASISAYFYSPVQSIFVGALVAIGTCLIAIKGRHGAEEVLLNFAGMFAFVVALVPTPLDAAMCVDEPYCLDVPERVGNNVGTLLFVGASSCCCRRGHGGATSVPVRVSTCG